LPLVVARFEPPVDDALQAAIDAFDCVTRRDGSEDPGEVKVREFLRGGAFANAAATGTTTTWLLADRDNAPHKVVGYVTLALTQIRLNRAEARDAELATAGRSAFGAVRIAMIGVDREFQHRGHGTLLINTVVLHTARMSNEVSVRGSSSLTPRVRRSTGTATGGSSRTTPMRSRSGSRSGQRRPACRRRACASISVPTRASCWSRSVRSGRSLRDLRA
jgi:ribosomal protein S18 acetylase RimI-like enzyme